MFPHLHYLATTLQRDCRRVQQHATHTTHKKYGKTIKSMVQDSNRLSEHSLIGTRSGWAGTETNARNIAHKQQNRNSNRALKPEAGNRAEQNKAPNKETAKDLVCPSYKHRKLPKGMHATKALPVCPKHGRYESLTLVHNPWWAMHKVSDVIRLR